MCRNIRLLHHFEPPTTRDEMEAAALQYVRKVSGTRAPGKVDKEVFDRAVRDIAEATAVLLAALPERGAATTREGERDKAKKRWTAREKRQGTPSSAAVKG
jgi:hypothetical protein